MIRRNLVVAAAAAGLLFCIYTVIRARRVPPAAEPVISPPTVPRGLRAIAGAGVIEAKRENIPLGTLVGGVVTEVYVKRGDMVKPGMPLFRLDDRELKAQLLVAESNLAAAEAQYERLKAAPQQGDIPTAEATVAEAKAHFVDAEVAYRRSETLFERNAEAAQDRDHDRYTYLANKATLARSEADLKRIKLTWDKDKEIYRAATMQAKSQVESTKINLERLLVRALVDGEVLQVHVRPGQYAGLVWNEPLIVLGDIHELHVRVDIDEQDLAYFTTAAWPWRRSRDDPRCVSLSPISTRSPTSSPSTASQVRILSASIPACSRCFMPCPGRPRSRSISGSRWTSISRRQSRPRGLTSMSTR